MKICYNSKQLILVSLAFPIKYQRIATLVNIFSWRKNTWIWKRTRLNVNIFRLFYSFQSLLLLTLFFSSFLLICISIVTHSMIPLTLTLSPLSPCFGLSTCVMTYMCMVAYHLLFLSYLQSLPYERFSPFLSNEEHINAHTSLHYHFIHIINNFPHIYYRHSLMEGYMHEWFRIKSKIQECTSRNRICINPSLIPISIKEKCRKCIVIFLLHFCWFISQTYLLFSTTHLHIFIE